jgi:hypothetical protein
MFWGSASISGSCIEQEHKEKKQMITMATASKVDTNLFFGCFIVVSSFKVLFICRHLSTSELYHIFSEKSIGGFKKPA